MKLSVIIGYKDLKHLGVAKYGVRGAWHHTDCELVQAPPHCHRPLRLCCSLWRLRQCACIIRSGESSADAVSEYHYRDNTSWAKNFEFLHGHLLEDW